MFKVASFSVCLLLVAAIATAQFLDPDESEIWIGDATGNDVVPPIWDSPAFPVPGCYYACPQGDTPPFGLQGNYTGPPFTGPGMCVEFVCKDPASHPIPDIPRTDIWLIDNPDIVNPYPTPLVLCTGGGAINADFATDFNGWTEIEDESFRVSGCTDHLAGVVVGYVITTSGDATDLHIEVRSVDQNGDLTVGLADLAIFAGRYLPNPYHPCADFDCNGVIGLADLARFAVHFGPPGHACQ